MRYLYVHHRRHRFFFQFCSGGEIANPSYTSYTTSSFVRLHVPVNASLVLVPGSYPPPPLLLSSSMSPLPPSHRCGAAVTSMLTGGATPRRRFSLGTSTKNWGVPQERWTTSAKKQVVIQSINVSTALADFSVWISPTVDAFLASKLFMVRPRR